MPTMRLPARLPLSGNDYVDVDGGSGRHRAPVDAGQGVDRRLAHDLGAVLDWLVEAPGAEASHGAASATITLP